MYLFLIITENDMKIKDIIYKMSKDKSFLLSDDFDQGLINTVGKLPSASKIFQLAPVITLFFKINSSTESKT